MIPLRSLTNGGLQERKAAVALNGCISMLVGGDIGTANIVQIKLLAVHDAKLIVPDSYVMNDWQAVFPAPTSLAPEIQHVYNP